MIDFERGGPNSARFFARTVDGETQPWATYIGRHDNEHEGTRAKAKRRQGK